MDLIEIFNEFHELGLVSEQRDLGRFFGRSRSWLSTSLARNRQPSIESLLFFLHTLNKQLIATANSAATAIDLDEREAYQAGEESLRAIHNTVQTTIWQRVLAQAENIED